MPLRPLLLWLMLMLASPCGQAIDAARGIHQLQHSSWTARDGAPDDIIVMAQGHDGFLWLGTHSGLLRFDGLRFEPVIARQGRYPDTVALALKGKLDLRAPPQQGPDGRLYLLELRGIRIIDSLAQYEQLNHPWIYRDTSGASGTSGSMQVDTGHERLPAGARDLQLTYNASSLGTPSRLRFHYLLDGYDRHWHSAGSRRQAQYTGLSPGSYRFRVMAFNGDGVASPVAELPFRLLPAFYQTWWFRTLCALALLAALCAAFRWRLRRHDARLRALLEAQQAERERIARELHDTLLQGTQAVILHFHNASMALPADEPARQSMLRALDAADRMLEEGRDHVQELRDGDGPCGGEHWAAILRREGEQLAALHGVVFGYLENGTPAALPPAASHEICRIAGEALRNAFAHAHARLIELEVHHARGMVQVDVRDDGVGLPPALAAGGRVAGHWGLPGMRERAAAIGAGLALVAREGGGTHWRLRVPLDWKQRWLQRWRRRS